jgi:hypothetical protein
MEGAEMRRPIPPGAGDEWSPENMDRPDNLSAWERQQRQRDAEEDDTRGGMLVAAILILGIGGVLAWLVDYLL